METQIDLIELIEQFCRNYDVSRALCLEDKVSSH